MSSIITGWLRVENWNLIGRTVGPAAQLRLSPNCRGFNGHHKVADEKEKTKADRQRGQIVEQER